LIVVAGARQPETSFEVSAAAGAERLGYLSPGVRKLIAIRLQAFIKLIADRQVDEFLLADTASAARYASSGTPVWTTRVTISAQATSNVPEQYFGSIKMGISAAL
jgi:hypothetical protein